jgi:serine/threonine-protein kinase
MKALAKDLDQRYASARELQADLEAFVRTHRLSVSRLALEKFMRDLFSEQLAREEEALREGKRVADVIHASDAPETSNALELSAVQRISRVIAPPPPPGRSPAVLAFAVIIAIAAAALALLLR